MFGQGYRAHLSGPIGVAHETQAILPFEVPQPVDHTVDVF